MSDPKKAKILQENVMADIQKNPSQKEEIFYEAAKKQVILQRKYTVDKKKGSPCGNGLTDKEFDRYWDLAQKAMQYQEQSTQPIIPFEDWIRSEKDRDFLKEIIEFKSNYQLIEAQMKVLSKTLRGMILNGTNIIVCAAFANNAIIYVSPKEDENEQAARLACNIILICNGLSPIPSCKEYEDAVQKDMQKSKRFDRPGKWAIHTKNLVECILFFNGKRICYACKTYECKKQCAACHYVYYCSSDCQKKNWPLHKKFCTLHKCKLIPWMKKTATQQIKEMDKYKTGTSFEYSKI